MKKLPAVTIAIIAILGAAPLRSSQFNNDDRADKGAASTVSSLEFVSRIGKQGGSVSRRVNAAVSDIAVVEEGNAVAIASRVGHVTIWNSNEGKKAASLKVQSSSPYAMAYSPDGLTLAVGGASGYVGLYNLSDSVSLWSITSGLPDDIFHPGSNGIVETLAFSPDGKLLATGGFGPNKAIRILDTANGQELRVLEKHNDAIYSIAFSPDGKTLASASGDLSVRIWETSTGRELFRLLGHEERVYTLAYTPDGESLLSGSGDETIRIWDTKTGLEKRRVKGLEEAIYSIAVSPDGNLFASGGSGCNIRIWQLACGTELCRSPCDGARGKGVSSVRFLPDGRKVLASDGDTVLVFKLVSR